MRKFKVNWLEREVIEYGHEVEVEVADDFVVNSSNLINVAKGCGMLDSKFTNYIEIGSYVRNGVLDIPEIEIDSYEEIPQPSPIDKKKEEYLDEIERLSFIIADTIAAKERVKELLKQLQ